MITWDSPDIGESEINAAVNSLKFSIGAKGPNIRAVERKFEEYIGCNHAILVANGTAALHTALHVAKNSFGHKEIQVPSFTFIASYNAAKTVFDEVNFADCISINDWNANHTGEGLILSVDVGGVPADYDSLNQFFVVADSAESLGSTYKGKMVGTQAPLHCFSFQRSKIITCGEGGLITTNDANLAAQCRAFINHGYSPSNKPHEYNHLDYGLNFRMCDVEAAILGEQLKKIDKYISHRHFIANIYDEQLYRLEKQDVSSDGTTNRFFYGVMVDPQSRENIVKKLYNDGIQVKCWTACHKQPFCAQDDTKFPNASYISDRVILLPIHNKLTEKEALFISSKLLSYV